MARSRTATVPKAAPVSKAGVARGGRKLQIKLGKHDYYSDSHIRNVLREVNSIAFVGASTRWNRPSYYAMKYLQRKGFRIIPINTGRGGDEILGEEVFASLADVPGHIDMVDIFRTSEEAGAITDDVLEIAKEKRVKVLWMQLGVRDDAASERAEAAGLTVIMNRCPKIEFARLSGELSWSGINSRIVTAKRMKSPKS